MNVELGNVELGNVELGNVELGNVEPSVAPRVASKVAPIRNTVRTVVLTLIGALLVPGVAQACAVCFSGRSDETRVAFIGTTAFMTFLPMLLVGGLVWWFRRRLQAMQAAERDGGLVQSD